MRACACASWALSRRIAALASLGAAGGRGAAGGCGAAGGRVPGAVARGGGLRAPSAPLRRFAGLAEVVLVLFFTGICNSGTSPILFLKKACRSSPRQDSPFRTPCHALPNLGPIL